MHLRAERKSPETVDNYTTGVRQFLAWCAQQDRPAVLDRASGHGRLGDHRGFLRLLDQARGRKPVRIETRTLQLCAITGPGDAGIRFPHARLAPASRCASRGGNGFLTVAATHAALLLAQGAGRPLRSMSDNGAVAVLDPRLATARYGGFLRASLPPFWTTYDPEVVRAALKRLDAAQTP